MERWSSVFGSPSLSSRNVWHRPNMLKPRSRGLGLALFENRRWTPYTTTCLTSATSMSEKLLFLFSSDLFRKCHLHPNLKNGAFWNEFNIGMHLCSDVQTSCATGSAGVQTFWIGI